MRIQGPVGHRGLRLRFDEDLTIWLERALAWSGAFFLGVALWMAGDAAFYQRRADARLRSAAAATATPATRAVSTGERIVPPDGPSAVAAGTALGWITIPRLEVDVVVAEGTSDTVLRRAVGHVPTSSRFGEDGNIVLAGHRDTFFRPLESIHAGDLILLGRPDRRDAYRVEWVAVVQPEALEVTRASGYPALTLVTCFPFSYVGQAPYRFVVRARRLDLTGAVDGPTTG